MQVTIVMGHNICEQGVRGCYRSSCIRTIIFVIQIHSMIKSSKPGVSNSQFGVHQLAFKRVIGCGERVGRLKVIVAASAVSNSQEDLNLR